MSAGDTSKIVPFQINITRYIPDEMISPLTKNIVHNSNFILKKKKKNTLFCKPYTKLRGFYEIVTKRMLSNCLYNPLALSGHCNLQLWPFDFKGLTPVLRKNFLEEHAERTGSLLTPC